MTTGGGDETVEVDSLGRPIRHLWHGPEPVCTTLACAGSQPPRVMQRIAYDDLGVYVAKRSVPASEIMPEGQLAYERWQYDALGRVAVYTAPWGAQTKLAYVGSAVQVTEPGKLPTITHRDALGRTTGVFDAAGGFTSYTYGPFGHMRAVTAPDGTVTTMVRDMWGRTKELVDPDRGVLNVVNPLYHVGKAVGDVYLAADKDRWVEAGAAGVQAVGTVGLLVYGAAAGGRSAGGGGGGGATLAEGSFSIVDWTGYPSGVPRPNGPFRLLQSGEYSAARGAANRVNDAMHRADASLRGQHVHEVHPVKFGGSPTDPANKIALPASAHWPLTVWWNQLQRDLMGNGQ